MDTPQPPDPSATPPEAPRSGFTLDLSSGAGAGSKRPKGFVPVVRQTINLSTKKTPAAPEATDARPEAPRQTEARTGAGPARTDGRRTDGARDGNRRPDARRDGGPRDGGPRDGGRRGDVRPSGGTSLADLLDEATLARLRGGA